jgi:hypothetical protein
MPGADAGPGASAAMHWFLQQVCGEFTGLDCRS